MTVPNIQKIPEENQPVIENLPGQPMDLSLHGDTQPFLTSQGPEPIPIWLMDLINTEDVIEVNSASEETQIVSLPNTVLSDQERVVATQSEFDVQPVGLSRAIELNYSTGPKSIWEEEDDLELGIPNPNQIFSNPIDELKILLDEDPYETAAFIRARMSDRSFREEASKSLRAYLTLDPNSDELWLIFEELQQFDSKQEE